jgi:hypothetical protein
MQRVLARGSDLQQGQRVRQGLTESLDTFGLILHCQDDPLTGNHSGAMRGEVYTLHTKVKSGIIYSSLFLQAVIGLESDDDGSYSRCRKF